MFGNMTNIMQQMQLAQKLMKNKEFRNFITHPKVQCLLKDSDFQEAIQSQDPKRISSHPGLMSLKEDPELAQLLTQVDFSDPVK